MTLPREWRIAIDGPAAGGKTTVARRVAQALGYAIIDTGAMYRAVALAALRSGQDVGDAAALGALTERTAATFQFLPDPVGPAGYRLKVDGEDVTERLHAPEVSRLVPQVAAVPDVRRVLSAEQRRLGLKGGVVMTGRDIGTVVLPEAEVKIFLTASAEERARRRVGDLGGRVDAAEVLADLRARDRQDETRADAPLVQAEDAILLDTTDMGIDDAVAWIVDRVRERAPV